MNLRGYLKEIGVVITVFAAIVTILVYFGITPESQNSSQPSISANSILIKNAYLKINYIDDSIFGWNYKQESPVLCPAQAIPLGTSFTCNFSIRYVSGTAWGNRTISGVSALPRGNFTVTKVVPSNKFNVSPWSYVNFTVYVLATKIPYSGDITFEINSH